ncbi:hypothetical protein T484DRAFT_1884221, partial [Baffinella frigidus]
AGPEAGRARGADLLSQSATPVTLPTNVATDNTRDRGAGGRGEVAGTVGAGAGEQPGDEPGGGDDGGHGRGGESAPSAAPLRAAPLAEEDSANGVSERGEARAPLGGTGQGAVSLGGGEVDAPVDRVGGLLARLEALQKKVAQE